MRRVMVMAVVVMGWLTSGATAQPKPEAAQLFEEARTLILQERYAEACPKLEESFRLDPAVGTSLNAALCYDKLGHLATAYEWYEWSAGMAMVSKQDAREAHARQQMARLDAEAPHFVVHFSKGVAGIEARLDGGLISIKTAMRINAGAHELELRAPGHSPWKGTWIAVNGRTTTLEIPELRRTSAAVEKRAPPAHPKAKRSNQLIASYIVGGASIAVLIAGVGYGVSARSEWNEAWRSGLPDHAETAKAHDKAATTLSVFGLFGLGTGALLWFTSPRDEARTGAVLAPAVSPGKLGVTYSGTF